MIGFLLLSLVVGVSTLWVWVSILTGMRKPTVTRSIFVLLSVFSATAVLFFGDGAGEPFLYFLTLLVWPFVWYLAFPTLFEAQLFIYLFGAATIMAGTLAIAFMSRGVSRVLALVAGAVLAALVPAIIENAIVAAQMTSKAEDAGLLIVEQSSFFRSAGEGLSFNRNAHGFACDDDNWPSLWSYRQRDWIPLPRDTHFLGDNPDHKKSYCLNRRQFLATR
ncbi:hypothetical protein [Ruegeria sp. A3M17]|uniref:hypothetical protein n=1 Tax=Ruegeria sp. A3M17 TaxID=2267229 RepID=UPI000DE9C697|nr:hypothetical protein [Ruegeria sp. A3M17]RBW52359.1 hypothetical protein DS906_21885 [Ruegeria sp. A3M17]